MEGTIYKLRLVQLGCGLLLLTIIVFAHLYPVHLSNGRQASVTIQLLIIFLALWSAVSGFTLQRRLLNRGASFRRSQKSTPLTRWRAANLFRIWSGASVGLYGLLLRLLGGPMIESDVLFGVGLMLLLLWKPSAAPSET